MRMQLATPVIAFLAMAIGSPLVHAQVASPNIQLFGLPVAAPLARYDLKGGEQRFVSFANAGKELWTMNNEGLLWRLNSKDLTVLEASQPTGLFFKMSYAFMYPDGKQIACAGWNGEACLLNTQYFDPDLIFPPYRVARTGSVLAVHFTPDGKYFATGSRDGIVRLYSLAPTKLEWQSAPMSLPITCLKISPDSKLVGVSTGDWQQWRTPGELVLFETETGKIAGQSQPHRAQVIYLTFSPDSKQVATSSSDGTVAIQPTSDLPSVSRLPCGSGVPRVAFLDERRLVAITERQPMYLWDLQKRTPLQLWQGHLSAQPNSTIRGFSISEDGTRMATIDLQGWIYLWGIDKS